MIYREMLGDLFELDVDYTLAHCISSDFALGKGIAVEFANRYDMKNKLIQTYPNYTNEPSIGGCILMDNVLNLVTKVKYYHKPTIESMTSSLRSMRSIVQSNGITKIAMPKIGCGLDKLDWNEVSDIIKSIFEDTDIEIVVCSLV